MECRMVGTISRRTESSGEGREDFSAANRSRGMKPRRSRRPRQSQRVVKVSTAATGGGPRQESSTECPTASVGPALLPCGPFRPDRAESSTNPYARRPACHTRRRCERAASGVRFFQTTVSTVTCLPRLLGSVVYRYVRRPREVPGCYPTRLRRWHVVFGARPHISRLGGHFQLVPSRRARARIIRKHIPRAHLLERLPEQVSQIFRRSS